MVHICNAAMQQCSNAKTQERERNGRERERNGANSDNATRRETEGRTEKTR
jgi:hypothetical protein